MIINQIVFFILLFVLFIVFASPKVTNRISTKTLKGFPVSQGLLISGGAFTIIAWLLYYILGANKEHFRFQVSPQIASCSKTRSAAKWSCGTKPGSPCCGVGFQGRKYTAEPNFFNYSSDFQRFRCPAHKHQITSAVTPAEGNIGSAVC